MNPRSVAVVGANNNPMKMGTMQALSIVKGGYRGRFYPVHPREKTVLGHQAYPSVSDLPEVPDLVMLVVPNDQVISLVDQFGAIGTRYAAVITAGFRESGAAGRLMEEQLKKTASHHGLRFLGPNCMGIINSQIALNLTVMPNPGEPGKLGMASQSGSYVTQSLSYLRRKGFRFSKAVSVGNEADIDIVDALEYLGEDDETGAIALYLEGIRDGARFIEVARKITPRKPVIAQYVGGTDAGARAGASHTGSMAGPDYLYDGVFKQAGIIRAASVEDLYAHGWTLANLPPLRGKRVAVVTNSGGPGTAIADTCARGGLEIPGFSESLQEEIRPYMPDHAASSNPVDLTFHLDAQVLSTVIPGIVAKSGEVDGIIIHGAMSHGYLRDIYPHIREMAGNISLEALLKQFGQNLNDTVSLPWRYDIPLVISSFFGNSDNYTVAYREKGVPVFDSPEKAAHAMLALLRHKEIRDRKKTLRPELPPPAPQAEAILAEALALGQKALDEYQAKRLLAAYGLPVTADRLAASGEEALAAAGHIGYPVAVKACSHRILHKTEHNLVHLDCRTPGAVGEAFAAVRKTAGEGVPVIVSPMIRGKRELAAGITRFPGFGPAVLFGLGGILTEALRDVTFRVAPLSQAEAEEMQADIRSARLLGNFRGMPAVDGGKMTDLLQSLSLIPLLHPEIAEMDLNPILLNGAEPVIADALVVLS
jgi:acetyltransferase